MANSKVVVSLLHNGTRKINLVQGSLHFKIQILLLSNLQIRRYLGLCFSKLQTKALLQVPSSKKPQTHSTKLWLQQLHNQINGQKILSLTWHHQRITFTHKLYLSKLLYNKCHNFSSSFNTNNNLPLTKCQINHFNELLYPLASQYKAQLANRRLFTLWTKLITI